MVSRLWPVLLVVAAMFLLGTRTQTPLFNNYLARPVLLLIPTLAVASLIYTYVLIRRAAWWKAWFASSLTIVSITLFGVVGLYPNLFPSSLDPAASLTAFNSASSPLTLKIMLGVALTFVPLVIAYQTWVHFLFKDKVTEQDVTYDEGY
jgi:cytochrome d ubiquinol oxidase subunit II